MSNPISDFIASSEIIQANGRSPLETLRARRTVCRDIVDRLAAEETRSTASGAREIRASITTGEDYLRKLDERISELEQQEKREAAAAQHHRDAGTTELEGTGSFRVGAGPEVYRRDKQTETSFFRDLYRSTQGDWAAADRLNRHKQAHQREQADVAEKRALGNTGGVGGSGGELAPPAWLVDEYVKLARPSRPCANLWTTRPLPSGVSSVNIPRIATGTTTAIQSTQNTALSQTDLTTNSLTSAIVTIGGKQIVSQQLLDQGGLPVDEVILGDLAADLTKQVDQQSLSGSGSSGQLKGVLNAGGTAITYTDAAPTQQKVLNAIIRAKNAVEVGRFLPATAILMHPTRWDWFLEWADGQGRPMVVPDGPAFNGAGTMTGQAAQGAAGTLAGLPVFLDAQMPTNQGAGTNQDSIVVARWEDLMLWEATPAFEGFRETYADSMGVLFRAYGYFAAIPNRYTASVSVIGGTGLVLPSL